MAGNGKVIGVLALQGDFEKHQHALERAGAKHIQVRTAEQLAQVDALVLPGGESSTMLRLMEYFDLFAPLQHFCQQKPVFGTCAGAILMANEVTSPAQKSFGVLDIAVERNGYGRQVDSRIIELDSTIGKLEAVFIRAPIIRSIGPEVKVLASYLDTPVLVQQGMHLAATFHPELTDDIQVHRHFLNSLPQ
ncbi:pyridoxal 5'-phosphate synthase glutaminase subunit PdxT [Bryobacter aggregatus]|uniref:pyridoxal 5'-phosphate synthase glutaminase subunit PdxT n=1 Tax=Bryobacter aggregatus TaxID=360054 RepID=UPI0004E1C230|nr:pyridoxal 5'-phosphate synthase glutaminase subunit PdxT [Bryobacter aggregatus]